MQIARSGTITRFQFGNGWIVSVVPDGGSLVLGGGSDVMVWNTRDVNDTVKFNYGHGYTESELLGVTDDKLVAVLHYVTHLPVAEVIARGIPKWIGDQLMQLAR